MTRIHPNGVYEVMGSACLCVFGDYISWKNGGSNVEHYTMHFVRLDARDPSACRTVATYNARVRKGTGTFEVDENIKPLADTPAEYFRDHPDANDPDREDDQGQVIDGL